MYAHYFKRVTQHWVYITPTMAPVDADLIQQVRGKAEARKIAREHHATPWNF